MTRRLGAAGLALVLAAGAACGSYSTYRTTRTAAPHRTDLLAALQVSGASSATGESAPLPELAVAARRGIGARTEVQLAGTLLAIPHAQTGSVELGGKHRLVAWGRWSVAVGAVAGYRIGESGGAVVEAGYVAAPVIAGLELGRHQLVGAITGGYQRWYSSGARPVDVPFVGPSLGFLWQLGRRWALLPEVGSAYTPVPNMVTTDSRLFHVGVAVVWSR
jgi:hypothetical protein